MAQVTGRGPGRYSLLQETLMRCSDISVDFRVSAPLIVCNEAHRFIVAEQAAEINIPVQPLILEPAGRNTAPALTVAALAQLDREEDPLLLMLPADHVVGNTADFHQALRTGVQLATDKFIVSFGIEPTQAATGYGYIKRDRELQTTGPDSAFLVADFIEKPEPDVAEGYLRSRKYLWNSGILMMQASVWLSAIRELQPEIYQACMTAYETGKKDDDFFRLAEQPFMDCQSNSISQSRLRDEKAYRAFRHRIKSVPYDHRTKKIPLVAQTEYAGQTCHGPQCAGVRAAQDCTD
ncbi:MAG: sugar phosphate nucleotidyltransferase [Candidatus Poribacteria bacterium]|nr:sugar phosphate nucleotidyltransferase [Candidatus Poribacteria bacterium]